MHVCLRVRIQAIAVDSTAQLTDITSLNRFHVEYYSHSNDQIQDLIRE